MFENINDSEIYKDIVDNMSAWVWICDKEKKTLYTNKSLQKMLGYNESQLKKISSQSLWSEESNSRIDTYILSEEKIQNINQPASLLLTWEITSLYQ